MSDDDENVSLLNEKAITPRFILTEALQEADNIECIAMIWKSKDGYLMASTSHMPIAMLALLSKRLDIYLERVLYSDDDGE